MKICARSIKPLPLLLVLVLAATSPHGVFAQSALDTSEAQAFLGAWSVAMESPQGNFVMDLEIQDSEGKVAASITADDMGGMQDVTDISRSGNDLVLRYDFFAQGQTVPVAVILTPAGDALDAAMDFADGMFVMYGRATK